MRYVADILTLFRLIASGVVAYAVITSHWTTAVVLFALGFLSDAFDGIAAARWPYNNREPRWFFWRKNPDAWDNAPDAALAVGTFAALCFTQLPWWFATGLLLGNLLIAVTYGLAIGPLKRRSLTAAKRLDIAYRWSFGLQLAGVLVWLIVLATDLWPWLLLIYLAATIQLVKLKWDHATFKDDPTYNQ